MIKHLFDIIQYSFYLCQDKGMCFWCIVQDKFKAEACSF